MIHRGGLPEAGGLPDLFEERQKGGPVGGLSDLVDVPVLGMGGELSVMGGLVVPKDKGFALEIWK